MIDFTKPLRMEDFADALGFAQYKPRTEKARRKEAKSIAAAIQAAIVDGLKDDKPKGERK